MSTTSVILEAFEAVERRDEARLRRLLDSRAEFLWPPSLPYRGSTWESVWDPLQPTPAERRMDPQLIAASGEEAVVLWHQRGVDRAGHQFECPVLGLYRVVQDKLLRAQMFYFDTIATANFLNDASAD